MKNAEAIVSEMLKVDGHYTAEGIIHEINKARIEVLELCMVMAWEQCTLGHPELIESNIKSLVNQVK